MTNRTALEDLQRIPGVGPKLADSLYSVGMRRVEDLRGADPQKLYEQLCSKAGRPIDRCVLYVFREAVYFASTDPADIELLKWWNWKDRS